MWIMIAASVSAFAVVSVAMFLTLHLVGPWLDRMERRLFDALDRFLEPIRDAYRAHLIVKAARIAKAQLEEDRGIIRD